MWLRANTRKRASGRWIRSVLGTALLLAVSTQAHAEIVDLERLRAQARLEAARFSGGPEAFAYIHRVATHPRCANCHGQVEDGIHVPTVGDQRQPHPMFITHRLDQLGHDCTSCHQRKNLDGPRLPPGASNNLMPTFLWHMPPESMIIPPGMTAAALCEQWTDPARNGNRGSLEDLATLREEFMFHVESDPLIHWAFKPGYGRTAAPGSREKLVGAVDRWLMWLESGATCAGL